MENSFLYDLSFNTLKIESKKKVLKNNFHFMNSTKNEIHELKKQLFEVITSKPDDHIR